MAVTFNRALPDTLAEGPLVLTERIYWDVTRTRLLAEGHPDARFLAYAKGTALPTAMAERIAGVERVTVAVPVEPVPPPEPTPPSVPDAGIPEKPTRRTRTRQDRQVGPGVVADTSIDGEAHVLVSEPGSPLRNGVDK